MKTTNRKINRGIVILATLLLLVCAIPTIAHAATSTTNVTYTSSFNGNGVSEIQNVTLTKRMTQATAAATGGGYVTLFVLDNNNNYLDSLYFKADGVSRTFSISYAARSYHMYFSADGNVLRASVAFN